MTWKKFEYFCNAVHYCIWIGFKKNYKYTRRCGDKLFSPLKYLFTKKLGKNIMKINGNICRNGMIYTLMVKMATL